MMFQINTKNYASDALEDAMRLAQTKSLNSYSFSDCMESLNYVWRDIYDKIALIDDGYYGRTVQLTNRLTRLPAFVKNTVMVYAAQSPVSSNRDIFRSSGTADLISSSTYRISGTDLFCPDAERRIVWLYYVPACPQIFFTHHNRDPKLHDDYKTARSSLYGVFKLVGVLPNGNEVDVSQEEVTDEVISSCVTWLIRNRATLENTDLTDAVIREPDPETGEWKLVFISCDFPYIFVTYRHTVTNEHHSGFFTKKMEFVEYNPFSFTGRNSDVEYLYTKWNDKTGLGVVVKDYNDLNEQTQPRIKELGWTPDTLLNYPAPEMYRYLVARLADKFSAFNESNIMGVQKELVDAKFAFEAFLDKDKSAWKRIENVAPRTITDWL